MKEYIVTAILLILLSAVVPKFHTALAIEVEAESAGILLAHVVQGDERSKTLEAYLASHDSPLTNEAGHFVTEADRLSLDWKLVAAIAGVESTFGKHIPTNSFNAWGWGVFTGAADGVHFNGWGDGISQVSEGLAQNYFGRGAKTVYDVGWIYAANGNSWGNHVQFFIDQIENFAPTHPEELDITI